MKESKVVFILQIMAGICFIVAGIQGNSLWKFIVGSILILIEIAYGLWIRYYNKNKSLR